MAQLFMRRGIVLLLALAAALHSSVPTDPSRVQIRAWSASNGLPEETIFGLTETTDGHIWIATRDGVTRFDGQSFRTLYPATQPGLRENAFSALYSTGNLLILGARDFLALAHTDAFQSHTNPRFEFIPFPRHPNDRFGITVIEPREAGGLWLARADGIFSFDWTTRKISAQYPSPHGERILSFHEGRSGRFWVSTTSHAYVRDKGDWIELPGAAPNITRLYESRDGLLWAYSPAGLDYWNGTKWVHFNHAGLPVFEASRAMIEDHEGNIWIGSLAGVRRINRSRPGGGTDWFDLSNRFRSDDLVSMLHQGSDGSIWAGTKWGSLARISEPSFQTVDNRNGLVDSAISAITEDTGGKLWISSRTHGLHREVDNLRFATTGQQAWNTHYATKAIPQGVLSLDSQGLSLHTDAGSRQLYDSPSQQFGAYRSFSPVYGDHIYFTDSVHLLKLRLPIGKDAVVESLGPLTLARRIVENSRGIWAISADVGLVRFHDGKQRVYPLDRLRELRGLSMFVLDEQYMLVGTNHGALVFDFKRDDFVPALTLFPDESIFAVQPDAIGNLWLACRRSLLSIPRSMVAEAVRARRSSILPLRFTAHHGLVSANFGLGTSAVSLLRANGELWFASINGAIHFRPEQILRSSQPLRCSVAALLVDGIEYPLQGKILLPAGTRNIEIRYNVLGGRADESPVFRYRLGPMQGQWIESTTTSAVFSNLRPAEYQFQLQGRSNSLEWNGPVASLDVSIDSFWYERPLVLSGIAVTLLLIAVLWVMNEEQKRRHAKFELEKRVADRTAELAQARDEAERLRIEAEGAARAKSAFLATMSHEIRTPMNGILGMLQLLRATPLNNEQHRLVEVLENSGDSLVNIVNDVLDLSKIESGRLQIETAPFSLREQFDYLAGMFSPLAAAKLLLFETSLDPDLEPRRIGDDARIKQILVNLLSNALKFTSHGKIWLSVKSAPDNAVEFTVSDTGIGIAPSKLEMIFDPFTQAESSTTRRFGGTGLGLAICLRLAKEMNGDLRVTSEEGQGAAFVLTLPLPVAPPLPKPVAKPVQTGPSELALRVLLVEDNAVNRYVASKLLQRFGCTLYQATDGIEALELVEQQQLDLILMDCHMPRLDGYDTTRQIRAGASPNVSVPIVALSAAVLEDEVEKCREAGMNDFLPKPIKGDDLRGLLQTVQAMQKGQPCGWPLSNSRLR